MLCKMCFRNERNVNMFIVKHELELIYMIFYTISVKKKYWEGLIGESVFSHFFIEKTSYNFGKKGY